MFSVCCLCCLEKRAGAYLDRVPARRYSGRLCSRAGGDLRSVDSFMHCYIMQVHDFLFRMVFITACCASSRPTKTLHWVTIGSSAWKQRTGLERHRSRPTTRAAVRGAGIRGARAPRRLRRASPAPGSGLCPRRSKAIAALASWCSGTGTCVLLSHGRRCGWSWLLQWRHVLLIQCGMTFSLHARRGRTYSCGHAHTLTPWHRGLRWRRM